MTIKQSAIAIERQRDDKMHCIAHKPNAYPSVAMKKITITDDGRFATSLPYICSQCNGAMKGGSVTITCKDGMDTVLDALCDVVAIDCKAHYLNERIKLPIECEFSRHAFIRALCEFDFETDRVLVRSLLNLTPQFLLGSFYDFCLDNLKIRWDEVVGLANENIALLLVGTNFTELLRYLIQNIEVRQDTVILSPKGVLDRNMQPIGGLYVNHSLPPEITAIETIVSCGPRKIFFMGECGPLGKFIHDLYGDTVVSENSMGGAEIISMSL